MHRLRAALQSQCDDLPPVQVGFLSGRALQSKCLVSQRNMGRIVVRVRVDGGRSDAHGLQGLQHPNGNLSSVGD